MLSSLVGGRMVQAEGLVPYAEELPYSTLMYATGDKQVRGGARGRQPPGWLSGRERVAAWRV